MARHLRRTLSAQAASDALESLAVWYAVALVGMLLAAAAVGWLLARRALAPLEEMTRFARRISSTGASARRAMSHPTPAAACLLYTSDAADE